MSFECSDCGAGFEVATREITGAGDEVETCPNCGSDDIMEVEEYDDDPTDLTGDD